MSASIPLKTLARRARRLDDRGMPLIEFVLVLPILILLGVGAIEVGTYALLNSKVQSAVANVANLATRGPELSQADVDDIFEAVHSSLAPFDVGISSAFVVTSVESDGNGGAFVAWQRGGAGSLTAASRVGASEAAAVLPDDLSVEAATVIIVEGFYSYQERGLGIVPDSLVYKVAYFRPRFGALAPPS